jgi:L-alanine-DL-glutamate epimerase-like enolase superfamily enzyme
MSSSPADRIQSVQAAVYRVPTATGGRERPESDGTLEWDHTDMLVVRVSTGGETGLGYSYTSAGALAVLRDTLWSVIGDADPLDSERLYWAMARAVRNLGWSGVSASAISAVDIAVHDLKARLLGVSLTRLLGGAHDGVPAYGSGGFTDYTDGELTEQLGSWAADGLSAVKIKVGTDPADDPRRVAVARDAIGPDVDLFVDANGAYTRKQALALADPFLDRGVSWFEEPVSSDDRQGLRMLRDRLPAPIRVAAGEYAYTLADFRDLLVDGCVDVVQADATRCGISGFTAAAALADAWGLPLSAHTAPGLHASVGAGCRAVTNVEYFHDHVRIESAFFDGVPALRHGDLLPDRAAPGHGLTLREADVEPYLVDGLSTALGTKGHA